MQDAVTVQVPSVEVPAAPSFSVEVPVGWSAVPRAGAMAAFEIEGRPDWSVVLSSLRVDATTTLRDMAVRTFARQRQLNPDAQIRVQRTGRFGSRLTYLREVALAGPTGGGALAQFQALFIVPVGRADLDDVMSIVATCPSGQLDDLGPAVVGMVSTFRLDDR